MATPATSEIPECVYPRRHQQHFDESRSRIGRFFFRGQYGLGRLKSESMENLRLGPAYEGTIASHASIPFTGQWWF